MGEFGVSRTVDPEATVREAADRPRSPSCVVNLERDDTMHMKIKV